MAITIIFMEKIFKKVIKERPEVKLSGEPVKRFNKK